MKITGIYKIQSRIKPERIYIGSSVNIYDRWIRHTYKLKINNHHSAKLQRHYNKYGKNDLIFSIILSCEKSELVDIEQYFMDIYEPYFNILKFARSAFGNKNCLGYKHSKEARNNMGKSHKKKILQFDINGNFIQEWDSTKKAAESLNLKRPNICSVLKGYNNSTGGFVFKSKSA